MQDRILNPDTIGETLLVLNLRNQHFDAELLLQEKMKPARLYPIQENGLTNCVPVSTSHTG